MIDIRDIKTRYSEIEKNITGVQLNGPKDGRRHPGNLNVSFDYIEGESFSVGYEFTQKFVKRLGLSALTVQAYMNDMFRLSTVKNERGIDYPFARTVSLSISATF